MLPLPEKVTEKVTHPWSSRRQTCMMQRLYISLKFQLRYRLGWGMYEQTTSHATNIAQSKRQGIYHRLRIFIKNIIFTRTIWAISSVTNTLI